MHPQSYQALQCQTNPWDSKLGTMYSYIFCEVAMKYTGQNSIVILQPMVFEIDYVCMASFTEVSRASWFLKKNEQYFLNHQSKRSITVQFTGTYSSNIVHRNILFGILGDQTSPKGFRFLLIFCSNCMQPWSIEFFIVPTLPVTRVFRF